MTISTLADLVGQLRTLELLSEDRLNETVRVLAPRFPAPKDLGRELVRLGWLTVFQVNLLFQGKGAGLVMGQYVLLERLGEGGMGTVYKARHRRLDRLAAVKCIRQELLAHPEALRRFHREIKAAARLSHPNVVLVHDADEHQGTHYCVLEYVEGTDLARLVKQEGPLSPPRACGYVIHAALGLQHVHEQGLVHRDIKPHNLLLTADGKLVKLLDLGLALLTLPGQNVSAALTRIGAMMGTADYVAPEQAADAHRVDIRADIYSLGCTLYHLLAGHPPFPGGTPMQKVAWHMHADPPALKGVPAGVADAVRRMMARRPEDRFQTPIEVARALEPFARARRADAPASPTRKPLATPTAIPVAAVAPVPSTMAGGPRVPTQIGGMTTPLAAPPSPPVPRGRGKRFLLVGLALVLMVGLAGGVLPSLLKKKDQDQARIEDDGTDPFPDGPSADPAIQAQQHLKRGADRLSRREHALALADADRAIKLNDSLHAAHALRARICFDSGDWDGAIASSTRALALDPKDKTVLQYRGGAYAAKKQYARAVADLSEWIRARPKDPLAWSARAGVYVKMRALKNAVRDYDEAIKLDGTLASAYKDRGEAHQQRGVKKRARADFKRAVELDGRLAGEAGPLLDRMAASALPRLSDAEGYRKRGQDLSGKREYVQAIDDFDEAIKLDPKSPDGYHERSRSYLELEEPELALEDCAEALSRTNEGKHFVHATIGHIHARAGDYAKSVETYTLAIQGDMKLGWLWRDRGFSHINGGTAFVDKALADADKAVELDSADYTAHQLRGMALSEKGDIPGALKSLDRAVELGPRAAWNYIQRARVFRKVPDLKKALEDCEKAIDCGRDFSTSYVERAVTYQALAAPDKDQSLYKKALDDLEKALELNSGESYAWSSRALLYQNLGKYPEAIADWTEAISLEPSGAWPLRNRAVCYDSIRDRVSASADRKLADDIERRR